jgi:ribose 5-phosphate isomerase B
MNIVIASDHAGYNMKKSIMAHFFKDINFIDVGTNSLQSVDYPDYAHLAVKAFNEKNADKIILICGSGNGIQMSANKHQNIRCALCWNEEVVSLARSHNDANAIAIPARFISTEQAYSFITTFISTSFEGGRHDRRKEKINCV